MSKRKSLTLPLVLLQVLLLCHVAAAARAGSSEREQDGLAGPVRRVKTETSKITAKGGKPVEGPRAVLETTTYDPKGNRVDDAVMAKLSQPAAAQPSPAAAAPAAAQPTGGATQKSSSSNAQTNSQTASQPKPSSPDAAKQTASAKTAARNTAAPLVVASLDKGTLADAGLNAPAASVSNVAVATGPAVKTEGDAPAAPSAPVRTGPLKPISGGILNGRALNLPPPTYPDAAKRAHASGLVEVEVVIDVNGKVISAKAVRGPALLMQAAEMAARLARFTPTLLSGQPVKVVGVINYNFSLQP
jgi:TonB family protein